MKPPHAADATTCANLCSSAQTRPRVPLRPAHAPTAASPSSALPTHVKRRTVLRASCACATIVEAATLPARSPPPTLPLSLVGLSLGPRPPAASVPCTRASLALVLLLGRCVRLSAAAAALSAGSQLHHAPQAHTAHLAPAVMAVRQCGAWQTNPCSTTKCGDGRPCLSEQLLQAAAMPCARFHEERSCAV